MLNDQYDSTNRQQLSLGFGFSFNDLYDEGLAPDETVIRHPANQIEEGIRVKT